MKCSVTYFLRSKLENSREGCGLWDAQTEKKKKMYHAPGDSLKNP